MFYLHFLLKNKLIYFFVDDYVVNDDAIGDYVIGVAGDYSIDDDVDDAVNDDDNDYNANDTDDKMLLIMNNNNVDNDDYNDDYYDDSYYDDDDSYPNLKYFLSNFHYTQS